MIASLQKHYGILRRLQYFLLVMEMLICLVRLLTQTLFALASALSLIQPLLVGFMMGNDATIRECQLYILIGLVIVYSLILNQIHNLARQSVRDGLLTERFIVEYKDWGYWVEIVVRSFGLLVAWRSYQLYKFLSEIGIDLVGIRTAM